MSEADERRLRRDEILKPVRSTLVPLPAVGPGICATCRAGCAIGCERFRQCSSAALALGPLPRILPISLSIDRQQLHRLLRGYKDDPQATARASSTSKLAAMTSEFVELHGDCIGAFDEIVPIPSSKRNAPQSVIGRVYSLKTRASNSIEALRKLGHGEYDADAFRATTAPGRRVLLFDDTFTSGSAVFSAAAAVRSSGGDVIGVLVLGRHVNPAWEPNEVMLKWLAATAWAPDKCCECGPARPAAMLW